MQVSAEMVLPAVPAPAPRRKGMLWAGRLLLGLSAVFAISAAGFFGLNLKDSLAAGQASQQIVGRWDGLTLTEVDGEDVFVVDGEAYIGIVSIPTLGVELPVNREWSRENAKTSPCRYTGSVAGSDMVIAAHNFDTHFGGIHKLAPGDEVTFTDTGGTVYRYAVSEVSELDGTDTEKMQEGDWDLTLFTCTIGGERRVTVRCVYADTY